ncbi:hypothetical protein O181_017128 [Austropuccinia psidii MF-1]|uniref:Integrase catalytic domain-containing protein n=1 Tax=Austropuccinia psidii MF-1 TaxID=1389203 RepID=A0A9Q3GRI6_9BASI|nr:hypothetical protein [Austropuccinia psidii MF-1]
MDWVTGLVPGGMEKLNACLVIIGSYSKSLRILGQPLQHAWKKNSFSTDYHPQKDALAQRIIQKMADIIRRFCEYGMEYKDHEGWTHDWVTLLPAVQLAYNTSQHSTTGKSPSLVEKWWNPLLPVDHLKKIF